MLLSWYPFGTLADFEMGFPYLGKLWTQSEGLFSAFMLFRVGDS